jgi:hypothetical protein
VADKDNRAGRDQAADVECLDALVVQVNGQTWDDCRRESRGNGDRLFSQATSLARRIALLCADPIGERFAQERWRDEQMLRRHWR